jgi:hypothetical protein
MLNRILTVALSALALSSASAYANGSLPSGVYQSAEGPAVIQSHGSSFTITDPSMPGVQINGNTSGQCTFFVAGSRIPCQAQVGQNQVFISIPTIQAQFALRYAGTVEQYLAAQNSAPAYPNQAYSNQGHPQTQSSTSPELPAITYDGMGNMDGTTTISDGGMSYDY